MGKQKELIKIDRDEVGKAAVAYLEAKKRATEADKDRVKLGKKFITLMKKKQRKKVTVEHETQYHVLSIRPREATDAIVDKKEKKKKVD